MDHDRVTLAYKLQHLLKFGAVGILAGDCIDECSINLHALKGSINCGSLL